MHITASRYVRYARGDNQQDKLTDLCISLESLLDGKTEIAFRFGCCLAKVTGSKGKKAEDSAQLLSQLYDLRSKIVHGDPEAIKAMQKMEPNIALLHTLARNLSLQRARKAYQYVTEKDKAFYAEIILNVRDSSYVRFKGAKSGATACGTLEFVKDPRKSDAIVVSRLDGNHRLWFADGHGGSFEAVDRQASVCFYSCPRLSKNSSFSVT
jgi:hypothetical protein